MFTIYYKFNLPTAIFPIDWWENVVNSKPVHVCQNPNDYNCFHRGESDGGVSPSLRVLLIVCKAGKFVPSRLDHSGHYLSCPGVAQNGKQ